MNWHEGTATTNNKTSIAENRRNSRVLKYNNYNYGLFDYSLFIFCFLIDHHIQFCSFKVYRFSLNWTANFKRTEERRRDFFLFLLAKTMCSISFARTPFSHVFNYQLGYEQNANKGRQKEWISFEMREKEGKKTSYNGNKNNL